MAEDFTYADYVGATPEYTKANPTNTGSGKTFSWQDALAGLNTVTNSAAGLIGAIRDRNEVRDQGYLRPGTLRYTGTNVGNIRDGTNWTPVLIIGGILAALIVVASIFSGRRGKS